MTERERLPNRRLSDFINVCAWHNQPVPVRHWIVRDRIPAANVTLLSGEGAIGKSILALHLGTAVALGRDWLSTMPDPGPVLIVSCEDDRDELWRRLNSIRQHYDASFADFHDMHAVALAGLDNIMAAPDRNGLIRPTPLFRQVREAALDIRPKLIILDNSADIYGGNENDCAQVRSFINLLRGMAIESGAGVLLTSHPSLTGINTGSGLSGSTAWNASVRSRLYFRRVVTEKDEEPDPTLRVLETLKSNYGPVGESITLRWRDGLFVPVSGVTNLERIAAEQQAAQLFLNLFERFNQQGRKLSDKPNAHNYAPKMMALEKDAKAQAIRKTNFEVAMRDLFTAGKIAVAPYGPPSKGMSRLVAK